MILDLLAAVIITYAFYRGFTKGFINTVVDTLSILVALVVALKFSPIVITYLQDMININPGLEFILGFILVFFVVMLTLRFIGERLEGVLRTVNLNIINQLAGGVLLGLVSAFIIGGLFALLVNLKILSEGYTEQSSLYGHLTAVSRDGQWIFEAFKNTFADFWGKFNATLDQVKDKLD